MISYSDLKASAGLATFTFDERFARSTDIPSLSPIAHLSVAFR
jgi:hypothetical protein